MRRQFILFIMINRMNPMLETIKIRVNQAKFPTAAPGPIDDDV